MKRLFPAIAVLLFVLAIGCERYLDERDPIVQAPGSGPTPTNLRTYINDAEVVLTWDMTSAAGVVRWRIYRADSIGGESELIDSSATPSVTLTDLRLNTTHWLQVAAVLSSGLEGPASEPVPVVPGHLSLRINNGAQYTRDRDIAVNISAGSGATDVLLSDDPDLAGAVWQAYSPSLSFRLSSGDGSKAVYGLVRFVDGSRSGDTLSDSIILDTRASISSVSFSPSDTVFGSGDTVVFTMQTGETDGLAEVTLPGVSAIELNDNGFDGDMVAGDAVYTGRWVVPMVFHLTAGVVRGVFVDVAGNQAEETRAETLINVHTAPMAPVLRAIADGPHEVFLTWDDAGNENLVAWRIHRGDAPSVTTTDTVVATLTSTSITNYSDTALQAATTYFYKVYAVYDQATMTGSNTVSATTLPGPVSRRQPDIESAVE